MICSYDHKHVDPKFVRVLALQREGQTWILVGYLFFTCTGILVWKLYNIISQFVIVFFRRSPFGHYRCCTGAGQGKSRKEWLQWDWEIFMLCAAWSCRNGGDTWRTFSAKRAWVCAQNLSICILGFRKKFLHLHFGWFPFVWLMTSDWDGCEPNPRKHVLSPMPSLDTISAATLPLPRRLTFVVKLVLECGREMWELLC